jgi:hypothetical protein
MADIYYKNMINGDVLYLDKHPYYLNRATDLFSHKWNYTNSDYADKIENFDMRFVEKQFTIAILEPRNNDTYADALKKIDNIFDACVRAVTPGRLYCGEDYLNCYIIANAKDNYDLRVNKSMQPYTLVAENGNWIRDVVYNISQGNDESIGFDYPYDFPFDYGHFRGFDNVINDTVAEADFTITFYGPVEFPAVDIGNQHYGVDITLEEGERVVIDSISRKVTKYSATSVETNVFSKRSRDNDIFMKIPSGKHHIEQNDDFAMKIVMYTYRTTPEWWKESVVNG